MSLSEQVVLVTGGTRGIGRAISLRLAREKPRQMVLAYCFDHAAAQRTVQELKQLGVDAVAMATDVSDAALLEQMFTSIEQRFGRLDVFIANAARTSFRPAVELSVRSWDRIMELNARAFLLGSQFAARLMRKGSGGRIVGISSLGSQRYVPHYAGLGAGKAALEALARYLAYELAPWGVNVNVVSAGYIDTETTRLHPEYQRLCEHVVSRTPARRLGTPEDVAGVVAFLCLPESEWIRGQTLIADGGFSLST